MNFSDSATDGIAQTVASKKSSFESESTCKRYKSSPADFSGWGGSLSEDSDLGELYVVRRSKGEVQSPEVHAISLEDFLASRKVHNTSSRENFGQKPLFDEDFSSSIPFGEPEVAQLLGESSLSLSSSSFFESKVLEIREKREGLDLFQIGDVMELLYVNIHC